MRPIPICLTLLLTAACAGTPKTALLDGREVPRLTIELTGQPYTVKHEGAHPRPGNPSSGLKDDGGVIRGRVCGMMVDYDVSHRGDHVQAVGTLDNQYNSAIDVSERDGVRHITGNLGNLGVDLELQRGQLTGHVGLRVIALEEREDHLQGWLRENFTTGGAVPITIGGKAALWEMPPADQAVVLANILTCQASWQLHTQVFDPFVVGFGGTATDRPSQTSSVNYSRQR